MATDWDKQSIELSPWLCGIINGEHGHLRFVFLFHYEISGSIRTSGATASKLGNVGKVGDLVAVRVKRKVNAFPDMKSLYDVEEMEVSRSGDSISEIRLEGKTVFICANVVPESRERKTQVLYDDYLGKVYDLVGHVPSNVFRNRHPVAVDLLIKGDKDDSSRSFLFVVKYNGLKENARPFKAVQKKCYGLIRSSNQAYFFVWSTDYEEELRLDRDIKGPLELGSWISFDSAERMDDGSYEIVGFPRPAQDQMETAVRQGVVMIRVNCRPLKMEDDLPILETGGAGPAADALHILRDADVDYPTHLWMEPQKNSRYPWRVSPSNGFRRSEKPPPERSNYGCIVAVSTSIGIGWIWSPGYPQDIAVGVELIEGIKDPAGKWVTFSEPTGPLDRLRSRGPIVPLNREPVKTRIRQDATELEVTLHSATGRESDGYPVFESDEVGDVVSPYGILGSNPQLPVTVWVVKNKSRAHAARWKVSNENIRRRDSPSRRPYASSIYSDGTGPSQGHPKDEERSSPHNGSTPRRNTDEHSVTSTTESTAAPANATDGRKSPSQLWMGPEKDSHYPPRVSPFKRLRRSEKAPSEKSNFGCIMTTSPRLTWIWSPGYPQDVRVGTELIEGIKDPVGKWVTFSEPTGPTDRLLSRGPVVPLNREPVKTRIRQGFPELEVTLHSAAGCESDGKPVFESDEVGDVVDSYRDVARRAQLPVTVWVVKHRDPAHVSRWKVSSKTSIRCAPDPPSRRPSSSSIYSDGTGSSEGHPKDEERSSPHNGLNPRRNTDELSVTSTTESTAVRGPGTVAEGQEKPLHERSLLSLCGSILENPDISLFLRECKGKEFFKAFATVVLSAKTDK